MISTNAGIISRKVGRESTHASNSGVAGSASSNTGKQKVHDPVEDFIFMEYDLAGEICGIVDQSLSALKKVIFGSGLLTPAIQAAATALLASTVPGEWKKQWDGGPEKPQGWLREIVRKRMALAKWKNDLSKGGTSNLLSAERSLNDLFNPGTFINALRQQSARQLNTAIDTVKMVCSWEKGYRSMDKCPLRCVLKDLLLQGARFDTILRASKAEESELVSTPFVCIGFTLKDAQDSYRAEEAVSVPVYLTPSREEFLMELQMPIDNRSSQDEWILSGVALCLSEED